MNEQNEKKLPPLPTTLDGWLGIMKPTAAPKLLDEVKEAFLAAVDDPEYNGRLVALIEAADNKSAVEGSLGADRIEAARIVREKGRELHKPLLSNAKLQVVANKMSPMLNKFEGASRGQRKKLLEAR